MRRPASVCILGYGKIARDAHGPAWKRAERAGLAAVRRVVEPTASGCAAAARDFPHATVDCSDARTAFASDAGLGVDVIDVCTPGPLHVELVLGALSAGCHVLVEKPLAHTSAEVEEIIAAQQGAVVQVCQTMRLSAPVRAVLAARRAGTLGNVRRLQVIHHARHILSEAEWVTTTRPDGAIFENAIHFIDLAHAIVGSSVPITVEACRFQQTEHRPVLTGFDLLGTAEGGESITIDFRQDSLAHSALISSVYVCASGADAELRFYPDGFRLLSGVIDPLHDIAASTRRLGGLARRFLPGPKPNSAHDVLIGGLLHPDDPDSFRCGPQDVRPAVALAEELSRRWRDSLGQPCA